jgi:hypothetical protein
MNAQNPYDEQRQGANDQFPMTEAQSQKHGGETVHRNYRLVFEHFCVHFMESHLINNRGGNQ